jgi:asparagine synthetase B (glutamine-hydrolysing)
MGIHIVVFVGTGGDEVFFGYPRYRFLPLKMLLDLLPSILLNIIRRFLSAVRMNDLSKNRINKFFSENSAIFTPEFDLKNYLPNQLFSAFDSLSFNNGIEARTPFTSILLLDHAVTSNNVRWFDFLILKLKLKILLYKKFGINKFFNQKKGFTNEYTKLGIDEKQINFNLFANYDQVQVAAKKSNLHLFRVFVLSRWLEC